MFVPKNEQGVIYLFSRYHEELGFEKILRIGTHFPDVIAVKDGAQIRIELEFLLSELLSHYIFKTANPNTEKWVQEHEDEDRVSWRLWRIQTVHPDTEDDTTWIKSSGSVSISKEIVKNIEEWDGALIWKSLKPSCDVVICWEVDCEIDDPEIEVIELKSLIPLL